MRPEADAAPLQFVIDAMQPPFQGRTRQLQLQVTEAQLQQLLVRQLHPSVTLTAVRWRAATGAGIHALTLAKPQDG